MWQSPNQRVRALANARKRERERLQQPFHIRRVNAELQIVGSASSEPVTTTARVVLNDLTAKSVGIFTALPLGSGQEVLITVTEPSSVQLRGKVVACQEYHNDSHILSANSFSYRVGIQFTFKSPEEEKAVKAFYDGLQGELHGSKAA
ncbi:MAG TPA: hypothetical protein VJB59_14900 [Bdellovibrionota bacterium]|nr:hypothetical protein [Bdellovibrionota bacterium]